MVHSLVAPFGERVSTPLGIAEYGPLVQHPLGLVHLI
jgi:hypothetical protein